MVKTSKALAQAVIGLVSGYFVAGSDMNLDSLPWVAAIGLGVVVVLVFLQWVFFTYRIEQNRLSIRSGIIKRKRLSVDFDRVQGIKLNQNPLFKLFKVYSLTMDTAGSTQEEVSLPGISTDEVSYLRKLVDKTTPAKIAEEQSKTESNLLSLDTRTLVITGLCSNALIFLAVIVAPLFSVPDNPVLGLVERYIFNGLESLFIWIFSKPLLIAFLLLIGLGVGVLSILAGLSILGTIIRYHGYTLIYRADRYLSKAGLLTSYEQSMAKQKIQLIRIEQNLRQQFFKTGSFNLTQAASRDQTGRKNFRIPNVDRGAFKVLLKHILPDYGDIEDSGFQAIHRSYTSRYFLYFVVTPTLATCVTLFFIFGTVSLFTLMLLPPGFLLVKLAHHRWGYQDLGACFAQRHGLFSKRYFLFEKRRCQRITISQSPYQRRKNLANLSFYLASGVVTVPFLPLEKAKHLQNEVLYQVVTDQEAWI